MKFGDFSLGDKIQKSFENVMDYVFSNVIKKFTPSIVENLKKEIALTSIKPEMFSTPEMKASVKDLKKKWANSPESASDIANDLIGMMAGFASSKQFEKLADTKLKAEMPVTNEVFGEIAKIADISLVSSILGIVGEFVPTTQLGQIGMEMRSYLDYSGVSQIAGFGYGNILNSAIGPLIQQEMAFDKQYALLTELDLTILRWRKEIEPIEFYHGMQKLGYSKERADQFRTAKKFYPTGQDFIRFAVRDVFNPEAVEIGQLETNFPEKIIPFVRKAGMSEEWIRKYWAAHWELPSPNMGYEMLHRGVISEADLEGLLRLADYAPGWIPNMIAISYANYTRVDARRMYKLGVLDDKSFIRAMKDIGYNDEKAQNLLSFTQMDQSEKERDLSQAVIIKGYTLGLIDRIPTIKYMMALGYDQNEATLLVSIEDEKVKQKIAEEELKILKRLYVLDLITQSAFIERAREVGILSTRAKQEMDQALRERAKNKKLPSKADVIEWYHGELIDIKEAERLLNSIGYAKKHIDLYLRKVVK